MLPRPEPRRAPTLDPTREVVYQFIDAFVGEMVALFPDAYWHVGGDEVNGVEWNASSRIRAFKQLHHLADNAALQAYFNQRLSRILTNHGKRMVGWDEILNPDLPATAMVQDQAGGMKVAGAAGSPEKKAGEPDKAPVKDKSADEKDKTPERGASIDRPVDEATKKRLLAK